ncbi:hypothetical protein QBC35DRAFT_247714 [Podospora australis]|uniref:DUF7580 domain-containing protein n=1 Tax=Podospora australis TaxID=1536484 RepID=A0AAN6X3T8_9PEZI|nr:hypothetical protein QBC35DRAFT_247714 [Podospora australis]
MSGFEVAGAILGSIPLLIAILKHYSEGVYVLQRWRNYKRELQFLIRNLENERVRLQDLIEKLLYGLVPPSQLEVMIASPMDGSYWRSEAVQRKVRVRLWEAYDVFEETIREVMAAIDEMTTRLNAQDDGKVSEFRRGIFTLRRSSYQDLLKRITDGIGSLENLTNRNIELEPSRRVRSRLKLVRILRDLSNSLYRALRSSFDCECSHHLGIKLDRRSDVVIMPGDDEETILCGLAFQFAVSSRSKAKTQQVWQELIAKAARLSSATMSPHSPPTPEPPAKRRKKGVRFTFSSSTACSSSTSRVVQTQVNGQPVFPGTSMTTGTHALQHITSKLNPCNLLQRPTGCIEHSGSFGVVIDSQPQADRKYEVSPCLRLNGTVPWTAISLREVLEQQSSSRLMPLCFRDRLRLAVVVSSSVLRFYGTPWPPEVLDSRKVLFTKPEKKI